MSALKICLVANTAWSFVRFRIDVIKSLVSAKHEVLLLAPEDEFVEQLTSLGARVILLKSLSRKGLNPIKDLMLYREFRRIYARERPDLIIQYTIKPNIYSTLAARYYHIPTVPVVTGLGYAFINKGIVTFVARKLYRFAFRSAIQVWFLNQDDFDIFVTKGLVDQKKALRIPGEGINCLNTFNPELVMAENKDPLVLNFLFIGRLLYDKGITEYVTAARQIKKKYSNVAFSVVGYLNVDNPAAVQESQLSEWVKEGWITYLGAVNDVRPVIANCDCVVLPSYREGMSTTLQESAAMAKPLIASDISGCKELVDDGVNGYLCRVKDTESLISAMERMIKLTPAERESMGRQGRNKMIAEFAIEHIITVYHKTVREILHSK